MSVHDTASSGNKRKPISRRLRYEILRRDDNTCRYCGGKAPDVALTIDHVVPVALGGSDDPTNLVAACKDCNSGKSSGSPDAALVAAVTEDAVRWSAAMQEAVARATQGDEAMRDRLDLIQTYWYEAIPRYRHNQPNYRLSTDWRAAIERLLVAGLPDGMVLDSIDVAAGAPSNLDNAFRYMLGTANNKLAKLHQEARAIVDADPKKTQMSVDDAYWQGVDHATDRWNQTYASHQYYALSRVIDAQGWAWKAAA